jgi:ribonucleotide reductase class II
MIASKISGFSKEYSTAYPVGYRTYARKSSNSEPRESGEQVKQRVLDGLFKLGKFTKEEQEKITQYLDKNQLFPSGRYLWCGGLEFSEKQPNYYSLYNCSNITIETWEDLAHNFNFLMQGNGSGAKLEYKNVNKLPVITSSINLEVVGNFGGKKLGQETTTVLYTPEKVVITVGDSRLGWCDAYQELLELSSNPESSSWDVVIDVSNVREKGSIIKGFGGKTNPSGLIPLFNRVVEITNKALGRQLTPLEVSFLANEAALCTVSGNIRRSARIDQFSKEDVESSTAKMNLWTQTPEGNWIKDKSKDALRMANFTRVWHQKPSQDEIKQALTTQFQCAEGAIQFAPEAVARANVDLLDDEEKKSKFIELYCEDQNQAVGYLSELWELNRTAQEYPLDDRELEHRMNRYGLNPLNLAA